MTSAAVHPAPIGKEMLMRTGRKTRSAQGSAYVLLLLLLATLATVASHGVRLGQAFQRQEAEQALLQIGLSYRQALGSYVQAGAEAPATLEDLLRDRRMPGVVRHLRRLYPDPLCGCPWGLVRDARGGIVGIYSRAEGRPVRQSGWPPDLTHFEHARRYADWVFGIQGAAANRPKS